jgi:uncharacterized protein YndB with AHSA1/START domain
MPEASNEIVIDRPPAEVFAFLANAENDVKWRQGVIEIRRESGDGVGTRYRQRVKGPGGRALAADVEITEYRPNELIGFRATAGPVRPRGRYVLTPANGGTRVRFELESELRGLKKLMGPLVGRTMQNEVGALANLKNVLESGS